MVSKPAEPPVARSLCAFDVTPFGGIDADAVAFVYEGWHMYDHAILDESRFVDVRNGGARQRWFGLLHGKFERGWQINSDRRAFIKFRLNFEPGRQPLGGVTKIVVAQGSLVEGLGVHEVMMRAVRVQVFHLVLFERRPFDSVHRAKTMLERRARANVAQLGLDHRPQIAGRVVTKLNYFARLSLE